MPRQPNIKGGSESDPAWKHAVVTPHDSTNLPDGICRALFIGTGGDIVVVDEDDTAIPYTVPDAYIFPFNAKRVNSTGTTADQIRAWY